MAQAAGFQVGEVGLKVILSTGFDLATATLVRVLARKPNGVSKAWVGVVEGPAADGKISYTTGLGDLDRAGRWRFQAEVTTAGGAKLIGEAVEVRVKAAFEL